MLAPIKKPDVNLNWIINTDEYSTSQNQPTLDTEKGKERLYQAIMMLIEQGNEIRIGSDGYCLILESNYIGDADSGYQWVDGEHKIEEIGWGEDDD